MPKRIGTRKKQGLKEALIERDGLFCTWCCKPLVNAPIEPGKDCDDHITLEHVVPLSHGGTWDLMHLALACFGCNNSRGSDLEWEVA